MATIAAYQESTEATEHTTPVAKSIESRSIEIQDGIRSIETRNWWSLFNTVSVVLLLTATIICLTLPSLVQSTEPLAELNIDLAVRGLVGLVLLFNVYAIWQQIRLKQLCDSIKESVKAISK
ncbi:MAG: hypothetical protein WAK91_03665 [Candidatus Acidiferrales bacterium]|jgi:short subunit fatty acids transporter